MTVDYSLTERNQELLHVGREVDESYVYPMSRRDGGTVRALTNVEMWGWIYYNRERGGPLIRIAKSWCVRWDSLFKEIFNDH